MVTALNRQEAHKRNLHARQSPQRIPRRIAHIQPRAEPAHADQDESVQRQQIRNEHISTPGRNHVPIKQRRQRTPHNTALLDRLDPQIKREDEQEDGNGFIIIGARHAARDVARRDAHENGGEQARGGRVHHLGGEEVGREGGEAGEGGREQDADVADVDGHGEGAQGMVDYARGHHEAGVERAARDAAEGVPCSCVQSIRRL